MGDGQAGPHTDSTALGRKTRIEDTQEMIRFNAFTGVGDFNHDGIVTIMSNRPAAC
jgi:hypothetical protein